VSSFETEKQESVEIVRIDEQKKEDEEEQLLLMKMSSENMKKMQAKKDEDPKMAKFKSAETVGEIYAIAEKLISGGDGKKSKLLKQIKQLKKALNLSVIKAQ
jgi:hypothetical protein